MYKIHEQLQSDKIYIERESTLFVDSPRTYKETKADLKTHITLTIKWSNRHILTPHFQQQSNNKIIQVLNYD